MSGREPKRDDEAALVLGQSDGARRTLRCLAVGLSASTALTALTLALLSGAPHAARSVSDLVTFGATLVTVYWCLLGLAHLRRQGNGIRGSVAACRSRVLRLLVAGSVLSALGQCVWCWYDLVLQKPVPILSWGDPLFLCSYPLLLVAVLSLPSEPLPISARLRVTVDGLVVATALVTFGWHLVLGPSLLEAQGSLLGRVVNTVYPLMDGMLVTGILALVARRREPALNPVHKAFMVALAAQVTADLLLALTALNGRAVHVGLSDVLWPFAMLVVGWAGRALALAPDPGSEAWGETAARPGIPWRSLLPYAFVPAVGLLVLHVSGNGGPPALRYGVYLGATCLVLLVLARQALSILENHQLLGRLSQAHRELESRNRQVIEHATHLEAMNERLRVMQEELVQSAKLASLGTLSAGVAHELNQPLAVIRGVVQQLAATEGLPAEVQEDLALVEGQSGRMMKIIQHLRAFSRAGRGESEPVDLNQVAQDCFILVGAQLRSRNIEVELDLCPDPPRVLADANELEQVVLNLLSNARDALEGQPQAKLTLRSWPSNGELFLEVRDNGSGIPEEALDRVFDPFFTTKDPGQGTGLGLSISHTIIRKYQGVLRCHNEGGAVFTLSLPVLPGPGQEEPAQLAMAVS